jgi:hypothetical protein
MYCQGEARTAIGFLLFQLSHPFREFLLQFFLAGQIELVFAGVNVGIFGKGNLDQSGILFLAEYDADGVVLCFSLNVAVMRRGQHR